MGVWYHELGQGLGPTSSTTRPGWRAVTAGRRRSSRTSPTPEQVRDAVRRAGAQVVDDTAQDGRPVVRVGLKVRYAPFVTRP